MVQKISFSFFIIGISLALVSWGVTGHRAIGKIAENHLTPKAKAAVQDLLGNQTLAEVSTYADEIRSQEEYKYTSPWHYINLPLNLSETDFEKQVSEMTKDNVYKALLKCEHDLQDPGTSKDQKVFALKFIVHLVGDLHQPMHVSRAEDQGGNKVQVNFDAKGTNLHSLWDSRLIEKQGLSYEQLAQKYDHASPEQVAQWQSDPIVKWLYESYLISSTLYSEIDQMTNRTITDDYYKYHLPIIEKRIEQGGIRLAGVLNETFK